MCGIIGYIGKKKCLPILIKGLKRLEYRGYDSCGVAYLKDNNINIIKSVGRITSLEEKLNLNEKSFIGIGHTRWATHGGVDINNSHPHKVNHITIVHNGIIENYKELKDILIKNNYKFKSETDTEIACAYIDYIYKKNNNIIDTLNTCIKDFIGSYAILIMVENIKDKLFVLKKDNPLIIGIGNNENYIASDVSAIYDNINKYIILEDLEIGIITNNNIEIYKNKKLIKPNIKEVNFDNYNNEKNGYQHYMLKEINEQIDIIPKLNQLYLNNINKIEDISNYTKIHIIACGTAYHAGLIGKYLFENFLNIEVNTYIASEYRYQKLFLDKNTLVIAISQSGETADTLACIKRVKEMGIKTLGIVNVENSSIARVVDKVIYTKCGSEIAVASTKAYTSQLYIFSMLALKIAIKKQLINIDNIKQEYQKLSNQIKTIINYD